MQNENKHISDHLANERTFLAWVRTAIAIMAFGFVVAKFTLFVRRLALLMGNDKVFSAPVKGYSGMLGILLVCLGLLTALFALLRYRRTKKNIEEETFAHSAKFINWFTGIIMVCGILLIIYLVMNG
jgi:putative membrane protein